MCFGVFYWKNGHFSAKFIEKKIWRKIKLVPQFLFKLSKNLDKASLYGPQKRCDMFFDNFHFLPFLRPQKSKNGIFLDFCLLVCAPKKCRKCSLKISKNVSQFFFNIPMRMLYVVIYWSFWCKMKDEFDFSQNLGQSLAIFSIYMDFPIYPVLLLCLAAQNFAKKMIFFNSVKRFC